MFSTIYTIISVISLVCACFDLVEPLWLSIVLWLPLADAAIVAAVFSRKTFRCSCGKTFRLGWWKLFNLCLIFKMPRTREGDGYRRMRFHDPAWVTCPCCGKWECGAARDDGHAA